jgi:hypothetical protein
MLTQPAGDESAAVFAPPPTSDIDHLVISCKQMDSSFRGVGFYREIPGEK